jgi:predicted amidohydrolase
MRIAIGQLDMAWEDKAATKDRILSLMSRLSPKERIDWLLFPEMTLTGFSMNALKARLDDSDLAFFGDLARRHQAHVSFGGVREGRNDFITLDQAGRMISTYSKMHLFSHGGENRAYRPGDQRERFLVGGMAVAPAVCFDLRFPYLFWSAAPQTHIFAVIACWPAQRAEHWTRLLQARAIENQCYVVGVNRAGRDPVAQYAGGSLIFGPMGETLLACPPSEGVFIAEQEVDAELVAKTRARLPFLQDRREVF